MEIKGKVHCFFEQSGTFKNEFLKLGIPAEDYDIQNNYNETDHVIDLFAEIQNAYDGKESIFDKISKDDLIMAFFPCVYFCDASMLYFQDYSLNLELQFKENKELRYRNIVERSQKRQLYYEILWKLITVVMAKKIQLIIENPWNQNRDSYLQKNFLKPTLIDKNRRLRGDYYKKPTAYWFINIEATSGCSYQKNKEIKSIKKAKKSNQAGVCSEERSIISPDYARNWICDFILGKSRSKRKTLFD